MWKRVSGKDRKERDHHESVACRRDRTDHGRQQDKTCFMVWNASLSPNGKCVWLEIRANAIALLARI